MKNLTIQMNGGNEHVLFENRLPWNTEYSREYLPNITRLEKGERNGFYARHMII
ncbi:MAG TPA: hypothetical protein PKD88_11710 [Nitrosomonas sp.]|nr:hypothetical protein [Nitrosomonas sp.]HMW21654.1 hypothetical protein [Nitrosomonas sp.]HMW69836.1 hypothetical protein [Nitrosomonas sp.]HMY62429.1 hypothetical protein [Nitrosomonas sp.]HMY91339.1 hypothetical protein [Nitrosomonas sp.]